MTPLIFKRLVYSKAINAPAFADFLTRCPKNDGKLPQDVCAITQHLLMKLEHTRAPLVFTLIDVAQFMNLLRADGIFFSSSASGLRLFNIERRHFYCYL